MLYAYILNFLLLFLCSTSYLLIQFYIFLYNLTNAIISLKFQFLISYTSLTKKNTFFFFVANCAWNFTHQFHSKFLLFLITVCIFNYSNYFYIQRTHMPNRKTINPQQAAKKNIITSEAPPEVSKYIFSITTWSY